MSAPISNPRRSPLAGKPTSACRARQPGLQIADDRAKQARREQSWSQRPGPVLTNSWQLPEGGSGRRRNMAELPSDLVADRTRAVGGGEASRFGGVGGGAQGMRAHVRDGRGLPGGFGGRRR